MKDHSLLRHESCFMTSHDNGRCILHISAFMHVEIFAFQTGEDVLCYKNNFTAKRFLFFLHGMAGKYTGSNLPLGREIRLYRYIYFYLQYSYPGTSF